MGRKRSSTAEDFVGLVAMLPWWGGVALAAASYVLFHSFATPPAVGATPAKAGAVLQSAMVYWFATIFQYLVPVLCLVAAVISWVGRRRRERLVTNVADSKDQKPLDAITWHEFEMLVGEAFRMDGFAVLETGGAGADGGVDLVLRKAGATYLVQCKQWKASLVPVTVVRELYGVMTHHKATGGFVVTSGRFTSDAESFAAGKNIQLLDGANLVARVRRASGGSRVQQPVAAAPTPSADAAPACPVCAAAMVRRTAKKGANAGQQFWGCSRFPECRGVR
jgi:restriction system protein